MASHRPGRTSYPCRLLLAVLAGAIIALAIAESGNSTTRAAANRCPTSATSKSVAYHCWTAYPEAFYVAGVTTATYRLKWTLTCGRQPISRTRSVGGVILVVVNQFTQPAAYRLMKSSDVCKVDVVATRTSGDGSIALELVINVEHPPPVHN